jgi:hypothetical protein
VWDQRYKALLDEGAEGPIALSIVGIVALAAASTPSPGPVDESIVTPGPWGFIIFFAVAVITILLILDMTRRIRRTRYRAEVRERLEQEQDAAGSEGPE